MGQRAHHVHDHRILGDAELHRDLGVTQILDLVHEEDLPAAGRQGRDRRLENPQLLARETRPLGRRLGIRKGLDRRELNGIRLLAPRLAPVIDRQIGGDAEEIGPGVARRMGVIVAWITLPSPT